MNFKREFELWWQRWLGLPRAEALGEACWMVEELREIERFAKEARRRLDETSSKRFRHHAWVDAGGQPACVVVEKDGTLRPDMGVAIWEVAEYLASLAQHTGLEQALLFNERPLVARPGLSVKEMLRNWERAAVAR